MKFVPCEGCPAISECRAKGCHQAELYYEQEMEWEQEQYDRQRQEECET